MPRASPSAKRQPGAVNARDTRNENGLGHHGKRIGRHQHKFASGPASSAGDAATRSSTADHNLRETPLSSASASAGGTPSSPPPLLAAAAAAAAAANGCTRDGDTMAPSAPTAHRGQQRHRNSDPSGAPSSSAGRRSHVTDRHHPNADNASLASSTDSLANLQPLVSAPGPCPTLSVSFDESHRRIDVNATKNANVHRDTGPFDLAITILRSCPLYDTIAILIILMQLSPVFLSIVYMLFTVLTFVPPVHTSSGLSLTEMFEGSLSNTAFTTTISMDVGILLVWLFLWRPLQLLILDFAQVVIALTLGGGCNGGGPRQGSANNIFVCLGIVIFSHFSHMPSIERLPHLGPLFAPDQSSVFSDHISFPPSSKFFSRRIGGASWVRNIFAIHILTQGIVRYIKEWYIRREKRDSMAHSLSDPETGKGTGAYAAETPMEVTFAGILDNAGHSGFGSNVSNAELNDHTNSLSSTIANNINGPAAGLGLGSGEADATLSSAATSGIPTGISVPATGHVSLKRKKRQSAFVRLRQPLWAALASTKIVMIKEYELSQAASESAGAEATDVDNLGNAPFYTQPGQIWICYVGHDEVCFSTSYFANDEAGLKLPSTSSVPSASFIDTTKPFYVRINNATWQPTRIVPITDKGDDEIIESYPSDAESKHSFASGSSTCWAGDIYGLTPLSSYEVEFVNTYSGEILFSTSVRTAAAPSRSTVVAAAKPAQSSQLRPHESPATTIKASIAMQEAKLNDEKTRAKTLRKENNRRVNALRKEIDRLAASVQSAGGNDDKFSKKIAQNTVQLKQHEQAVERLEEKLKDVSAIPDDLLSQHRNKKSEWDKEKAHFDGAVASFKSFKSSVDNEIRTLEDDQATLLAKKTKIAARISKADSEHAQIMDANARGLDEAERRRQERANIENEIARSHQSYMERLSAIQSANEEKVRTIEALHETMRSFYSSFDSERPYENRYPVGQTPTVPITSAIPASTPGAWPTPQIPPSTLYTPSSLWPPMQGLPTSGHSPNASHQSPATSYMHMHLHTSPMPQPLKMRGRSSSMLSDISGFTQSSMADEDNVILAGGSNGVASQNIGGFVGSDVSATLTAQAGTTRGSLGFSLAGDQASSGSGSGSSSSVLSGSGSAGSARDPASPLMA